MNHAAPHRLDPRRPPRQAFAAASRGMPMRLALTLALLTALTLALLLTPRPGRAAPMDRQQALQGLQAASSVIRLDAVKRLGEVGLATDSDALLDRLADDDIQVRAAAAQSVWKAWGRSGDADIDTQYQLGLRQLSTGELDEAIATFGLILRHKPAFAEAWNKRATAYYLRGDFVRSLADCDKVFELAPRHFGALAGAATIHARLGRPERALELFKRALAVNPNMDDSSEIIRTLEKQIADKRGDMI